MTNSTREKEEPLWNSGSRYGGVPVFVATKKELTTDEFMPVLTGLAALSKSNTQFMNRIYEEVVHKYPEFGSVRKLQFSSIFKLQRIVAKNLKDDRCSFSFRYAIEHTKGFIFKTKHTFMKYIDVSFTVQWKSFDVSKIPLHITTVNRQLST